MDNQTEAFIDREDVVIEYSDTAVLVRHENWWWHCSAFTLEVAAIRAMRKEHAYLHAFAEWKLKDIGKMISKASIREGDGVLTILTQEPRLLRILLEAAEEVWEDSRE
jgi:hypothetical protein